MTWQDKAQAVVTFAFDDGYAQTVESTAGLLSEHGWSGTYGVITGRVGQVFDGIPLATWSHLLQAVCLGHEVASHGLDHSPLAGLTSDIRRWLKGTAMHGGGLRFALQSLAMAKAARKSPGPHAIGRENLANHLFATRAQIEQNLPGAQASSFIYPAGRYNRPSCQAVQTAGFVSARSLDLGLNRFPLHRFRLKAVSVWPGMDLKVLEGWLDQAARQCAWLVLVFHLVAPQNSTGYPYFYPVSAFQRFLDRVQSSSVRVASQAEAVSLFSAHPLALATPDA
jgi:peptidoglycan/xylan/chitin deacetylase (PgdA/CDA1 family)